MRPILRSTIDKYGSSDVFDMYIYSGEIVEFVNDLVTNMFRPM